MAVQMLRRHTTRLPGGIHVTTLRTRGIPAHVIRELLFSAQLYCFAGPQPSCPRRSCASYVGISSGLSPKVRCGVSLHEWTVRRRRIHPEVIVLINRPARPISDDALLLMEASIGQTLSLRHTELNIRLAANGAYERSTRRERLWAMDVTRRVTGLIEGSILYGHPRGPVGGTVREQLVRLTHKHGLALGVDELLTLARAQRIPLASTWPDQQIRRDLTTRTRRTALGCPRVLSFRWEGRTVMYPAGTMRLAQARADYASRTREARGPNSAGAAAIERRRHAADPAHAKPTGTPPQAA
jgi:hypothetical protein